MNDGRAGPGHRNYLLGLSRSFMASRVFLTAVELGLFTVLADRSLDAEEIAGELDADPRAVALLLNALVGLELLDHEDGRFSNREGLAHLLLPRSAGGEEGFGYAPRLWQTWSGLTEAVRSGRPPLAEPGREREQALGLRQFALGRGCELAPFLDLPEGGRVLDLGGGAGDQTVEILRQRPDLSAVILDRSESALGLAGDEIARAGLGGRVRLMRGDFFRDELGEGYDLVLLFSVLCLFEERENRELLGRVHGALNEGGTVAIRDAMTDESETGPIWAVLFALHMMLTGGEGGAHSYERVAGWMRDAGFARIRRVPLAGSQLLLGVRTSRP
jgi:SAM-dependent methyltransferase